MKTFIGPPLDVSFHQYYGMDEQQCIQAIEKYREYFSQKGIFENEVYPGMTDFLQSLIDEGKILYVCTSKPTIYAQQIIEHFGLSSYFHDVYGSELDGTRKNKKDVIAYCLECENLDVNDCIMVGDRQHDVIGAHENDMKCIGVLYGYGDFNEFMQCDCDYIVNNINELKGVLDEI